MLKKKSLQPSFDGDPQNDGTGETFTPITAKIATYLEQFTIYFYSICSYDMDQWDIAFISQWVILNFQIMRFLSDAFLPYGWNNSIAQVAIPISNYVTEIPWVSPMVAYYMTVGAFATIIILIAFSTLTHYYFQWTQPLRLMRQGLFWSNVLVFPEIIPHFKMIFPCFSYSASEFTPHPYYDELVCWQGAYNGYFVLSVFIAVNGALLNYLNAMCFYNAVIPNEIQVRNLRLNSKYSGNTETVVITMKIILLSLNVAGRGSDWRLALGALTFLCGAASTLHVIWVMPWWHDLTMTLYIFKALTLTWTGLTAMLTVPFGSGDGIGLLYYLMLPVLFVVSHLMLRWRFFNVLSTSTHELNSALLAILKIRSITRAFIHWAAQFDGMYLEMTPELQMEIEKRSFLTAHAIEIATERFPDSVDLHILCAQYYMTVQLNRVLAYRALRLAEKAGGNLDNRFRCWAIRQALDTAVDDEISDELKIYTEFKATKELGERVLSRAMATLVHFWSEALQPSPNLVTLASIGEQARHQLDQSIRHFERLLQLNSRSIPVLRLYGVLCLEVLGDSDRAGVMFNLADQVIQDRRKIMLDCNYGQFLKTMESKLDVFDEHNAVVSISINPDSIGVVQSVNPAFVKMMGLFSGKDIVGKNIKMIIPEPVRSYHDRYIHDYSISRKSLIINKNLMLMAVHHQGHLIPCVAYIRWANKAIGTMIATMQTTINQHELAFFVDVHTWTITYATANFIPVLGFNKRDLRAQKLTLFDVLPELREEEGEDTVSDKIYSQLVNEKGYLARVSHAITQQPFHLHCYLSYIGIYDTAALFFRGEVSQIQQEEEAELSEDGVEDLFMLREYSHSPSPTQSHTHSHVFAHPHAQAQAYNGSHRSGSRSANGSARASGRSTASAMGSGSRRASGGGSVAGGSVGNSRRRMSLSAAMFTQDDYDNASGYGYGHNLNGADVKKKTKDSTGRYRHSARVRSHNRHDSSSSSCSSSSSNSDISSDISSDNEEEEKERTTTSTSPRMGIISRIRDISRKTDFSENSAETSRSGYGNDSVAAGIGDSSVSLSARAASATHTPPPPQFLSLPCAPRIHMPDARVAGTDTHTDAHAGQLSARSSDSASARGSGNGLGSSGTDGRSAHDKDKRGSGSIAPGSTSPFLLQSPSRVLASASSPHTSPLVSSMSHVIANNNANANANASISGQSPVYTSTDPHNPTDNAATTATSTIVPFTSASLLMRRRRAVQRRLKAAIANDNARTRRRLRWFTLFSCVIVCSAIALVLADLILTEIDVVHARSLIQQISVASQRQVFSVGITLTLHVYLLFHRHPNATELTDILSKKGYPFPVLQTYFGTVAKTYANLFYARSRELETAITKSDKRRALRLHDDVSVYVRDPSVPEMWKQQDMSLNAAVLNFGALAQWSLYEQKEAIKDDYGQFFVVSNIVSGTLIDAFDREIEYMNEEIRDTGTQMLTNTIIFFSVAVVGTALIAMMLLIPLLLHVERSKARVLGIFTAVPRGVRKTLRKKALSVYKLVVKVEEADKGIAGHDSEDDEDEGEMSAGGGLGGTVGGGGGVSVGMRMGGALSVADSVGTSYTHTTGTSGGTDDIYTVIFRRYTHARGGAEGLATVEEEAATGWQKRKMSQLWGEATIAGEKGPAEGAGNTRDTNTTTTTTADNTTTTAGAGADVDSVDGTAILSSNNMAPLRSGRDGARGGGSARSRGGSSRANNTINSAGAGAGVDRGGIGKGRGTYNVWLGTGMITSATRFSVFAAVLLGYFIGIIVMTMNVQTRVDNAVTHITTSDLRNPRLGLAMFYSLEHLFNDQSEAELANPLDPVTFVGEDYVSASLRELEVAKNALSSLAYGQTDGYASATSDEEQGKLLFHSLCEVDPVRFASVYSESVAFPYILPDCANPGGGILTRGLFSTFMYIYEGVQALLQPQYRKSLSYVLSGETPQADAAIIASAKSTFVDIFEVYYDYLLHFLRYSGLLYVEKAASILARFDSVRYLLVALCLAFLVLSLFVLLLPVTVLLKKTAHQTNAMLTLLPPQIVGHVREMQQFIDDNLSKD